MAKLKEEYKKVIRKCFRKPTQMSEQDFKEFVDEQIKNMETNFINPNELFEIDPDPKFFIANNKQKEFFESDKEYKFNG